MFSKNVLVIAYYFPPMGLSGVQRTVKFVKYLPDFGWKPFVLTTGSSRYFAFDESLLNDFKDKPVEIFRTYTKKSQKQDYKIQNFPNYTIQKIGRVITQAIYQPDRFIKWKKSAIELGEKIIKENKIDAIFATAPPFTDFLVALELSEKYDIPFIMDYRDVWVDNPFHYYLTPFHKSYSIKLEENLLKKTSKAIVTNRFAKEIILRRYKFISHDDIAIIPHGYDPDDFKEIEFHHNPNFFTITHSGLFQDDRNPKYFLKAVSQFLKNNPSAIDKLRLRFIGLMRKSHQKLLKKYNLQKITTLTGNLSHRESIKNLLESDLLWLVVNDIYRSPGKLFEYFGAEKPILICAPEGIMRKTALESKAAIGVDPKDVNEIEKALSTFYNLWTKNTLPKPSPEFIELYNRKKLTQDLAKELTLISEL
ncbi:MAG: glycosyltransferase [Candidatus Kapabacteria bacterium]|nr:glycosyltransferase [Candidatus Kapabacteria bacterium]